METISLLSELHAALFQALITAGLATLTGGLYLRYRRRYLLWWTAAWALYLARIGVISAFLIVGDQRLLFVHQVLTGWTALALLWSALQFSQERELRRYLVVALFPLVWSYVAIYELHNFFMAAWPAVLFLSGATFWTGWVFLRHHRRAGSPGARLLAIGFFLWGVHHLDYPLLRARGAWNPWGYYIDIALMLLAGIGILMLVIDELGRGLSTLSVLSGDLQRGDAGASTDDLLARPLALQGVRGSALYIGEAAAGRFVAGRGACAEWPEMPLPPALANVIASALARREPLVTREHLSPGNGAMPVHAYLAVLPLFSETAVMGALVITGDERDPFTALDDSFLLALGRQVGAAIERSDLLRRLGDQTRDLQRLSVNVLRQQEGERRKISLELHDETAQLFAAVKMQLGLLQEASDAEVRARLERVLGLIDAGIHSIRRVSSALRPPLLDDLGFLRALRALIDEFAQRTGITTTLDAPDALRLREEAEVALFRATQEALSNVARHARANRVAVTLARDNGRVTLSVRDDGRGLEAPVAGGLPANARMGLSGMHERVIAVGGDLTLESRPGGGVDVRIQLPAEEQ